MYIIVHDTPRTRQQLQSQHVRTEQEEAPFPAKCPRQRSPDRDLHSFACTAAPASLITKRYRAHCLFPL